MYSHVGLEHLIENEGKLVAELKDKVGLLFGGLGQAKIFASLKIVYLNLPAKYFVVRVARNYHSIFIKTLFLIKDFQGVEIRFCMRFVTGTIKKLEEKLILYFKSQKDKDLVSLSDRIRNDLKFN